MLFLIALCCQAHPYWDHQNLSHVCRQEPSTTSHQQLWPPWFPTVNFFDICFLCKQCSEDDTPCPAPSIKLCSIHRIIILQVLSHLYISHKKNQHLHNASRCRALLHGIMLHAEQQQESHDSIEHCIQNTSVSQTKSSMKSGHNLYKQKEKWPVKNFIYIKYWFPQHSKFLKHCLSNLQLKKLGPENS